MACKYIHIFYVHVNANRNKFLYNKTNQMHQFPKFTPAWNSTCFGQILCLSSGVYSLYTQHWYMSYRFEDSFRAGPGWNSILVLLVSCLQNCMTYNSVDCTVNKLVMMGRRMSGKCRVSCRSKFGKLMNLVGFIIKKIHSCIFIFHWNKYWLVC